MKNIHVLPTEKETVKGDLLLRHIWKDTSNECISWWRYKDTIVIDDALQYTTLNGSFRDITSSFKVQNIYITSDERIERGDWVFDAENEEHIYRASDVDLSNIRSLKSLYCKKIILTTDVDLIKYGVQAIDDEFLEWFVKNPSCEEIVVEKMFNVVQFTSREYIYKIIIPKEEPKQETLEEFAKQEAIKQYSEDTFGNLIVRKSIEKGAKWQQERMYSEEYLKEIIYLTWLKCLDANGGDFIDNRNEILKKFKNK